MDTQQTTQPSPTATDLLLGMEDTEFERLIETIFTENERKEVIKAMKKLQKTKEQYQTVTLFGENYPKEKIIKYLIEKRNLMENLQKKLPLQTAKSFCRGLLDLKREGFDDEVYKRALLLTIFSVLDTLERSHHKTFKDNLNLQKEFDFLVAVRSNDVGHIRFKVSNDTSSIPTLEHIQKGLKQENKADQYSKIIVKELNGNFKIYRLDREQVIQIVHRVAQKIYDNIDLDLSQFFQGLNNPKDENSNSYSQHVEKSNNISTVNESSTLMGLYEIEVIMMALYNRVLFMLTQVSEESGESEAVRLLNYVNSSVELFYDDATIKELDKKSFLRYGNFYSFRKCIRFTR